MTEDDDPPNGAVPDTDPRHIDPAGDMAELIESGDVDDHLSAIQDANAEENEYTTVEEAVDERQAALEG